VKSLAGSIALGGVLALAIGCGAKRLQPDAGGSSSGGSIDIDGGRAGTGAATGAGGSAGAGAATGEGGATGAAGGGGIGTDGGGGGLFTGRRSFVVMSTLTLDGSSAPAGAPTSHVFTMVVDGDRWTAILGANGQGFVSAIEPAAGGFRLADPVGFGLPGSSYSWLVSYTDLSFALDPTGLLNGRGSGRLVLDGGGGCNANYMSTATMSLTGTFDGVAPLLTFAAAGDMADPFSSFGVSASEPLPGQTAHPVLRSASGDAVVFAPSFTTPDSFITAFVKPSIVLRFGEQYSIDMSGVIDFAGNAAVAPSTGGLTFATAPLPPLVAADGFETTTATSLGGAELLSGPDDPIISGTRSLYLPSGESFTSQATKTTLAFRLAVSPGASLLRFSYRIVNPANTDYSYFAFGSVGRSIGSASLSYQSGSTMATIAGTPVELGPLSNFAVSLPADVTDEIVVERISPRDYCVGFGSHPTQGIIIDDLRAE